MVVDSKRAPLPPSTQRVLEQTRRSLEQQNTRVSTALKKSLVTIKLSHFTDKLEDNGLLQCYYGVTK